MSQEMFEGQLSRRRLVQAAAAAAAIAAMPASARFAAAEDTIKIAFSVPGLNFPFFVHMMNLAKMHAEELGGIEFIQLDGQDQGKPSSTKQSADLEAAVAQGIKGLVISPNDAAALGPAIQAVLDAGIPVVTVDRNVDASVKTLAHVGADNVRGGEIQGEYVLTLLPDGGDIFELQGQPGASPAIDRSAGLVKALEGQDKVKISASQTAEFARDKAVTVFEAMLAGSGEPKAVVAANDDMAFGVSEVAQANGLMMPIIGFDALPEALVAINDGKMAATIEQFPGKQATTAMDILLAKIKDGKDPEKHDNFLEPALITKETLATAERAAEAGIAAEGEMDAAATPSA
ncbi:MAG: substrate-binding domain-containing protein [Thermomicrobiales bacterium]